ncbi:MAG: dienelactone hydrolase family protein [Glaciihabitans sp.]|nr:dienelactone hydrolase family protein [Glaciihabitans sp.]
MTAMINLDGGNLTAYRSDPEGEVRGAVIVIHEIWGLVDHIKDIADRFAGEGYIAIAPDLLTGVGIPPEVGLQLIPLMFEPDEEKRTAAQPILREKLAPLGSPEFGQWAVAALGSVVDYLADIPAVNGNIAVVGYCFGGTYSFALAAADPRVRAAVPYYGQPPASTDIAAIACPVLALYGELDPGLMASLPDVTASMEEAGIDFSSKVYGGAKHAFFNDTNSTTYNEVAAVDAWERTTAFLATNLTR